MVVLSEILRETGDLIAERIMMDTYKIVVLAIKSAQSFFDWSRYVVDAQHIL